jgi:hypothetical protein
VVLIKLHFPNLFLNVRKNPCLTRHERYSSHYSLPRTCDVVDEPVHPPSMDDVDDDMKLSAVKALCGRPKKRKREGGDGLPPPSEGDVIPPGTQVGIREYPRGHHISSSLTFRLLFRPLVM